MKIRVWLLDATYQVVGREPHVLLWGIDEEGNRVLLRDKTFRPYFYVLPESPDLAESIASRIKAISIPKSPILSAEVVDRKYYGRPVKAVKVTTLLPDHVPKYREEAARLSGVKEVLEADIRFAMRYLIDHDLKPCGWHEAEVEEVNKTPGFHIDKEYVLKKPMKPLEESKPPSDLRIMAFDIEVYNPRGAPRPEVDPVIIISIMTSDGRIEQITAGDDKNDREVILKFVKFVKEYDPDIIVGYNSNRFDWPYLLERARKVGVRLAVSRAGTEPSPSVYGHISVMGRLNVDLYDFAEEIPEVKVKTLENVAEYLGVMKKSERVIIEWTEMPKYWDDPKLRPKFLEYAKHDVIATYGLAEKFLPFGMQLSYVTGLPLDQVGAASVGFRLEWYLIREAYKYGELVPNRVERPYEPYRGAVVLEPKRGVHENVVVLDFSSMYPNIMIKYNVGPDTYVRPDEPYDPDNVWVAPEVGHKFRKHPPGFFKRVLETLLQVRKRIREEMKKLDPTSPEYRILDERQKAVKVLANATYGYMGWTGARWYCRPCAEAVTAWGRETITKAISYARSIGLEVIYGDTDSLFVKNDPEKVKKLIEFVEKELGFEIKVDKVYKRVFFTEAKKRYAGLLEDGRIDIVGFEAVRGDWADIAKEVQEKIVEIVLREGDVNKAKEYVRKVVMDLKEHRVPLDKLIIWKTLTKKLEEYTTEAPHVAAARRAIESGAKISKGDKIGYVIVKGHGKLAHRAYPYWMVKIEDVDADYYIDHQVIPAAMRILGYFGITETQLKATMTGQKSLFDFFGAR